MITLSNDMNNGSRSPSQYVISKNSSLSDFKVRFKRKTNTTYNKKITSLSEIEHIEENISEITTRFLQNNPNVPKVIQFRNKYKHLLQGSYIDLILIIKDFPDFNLFDYITVSQSNQYIKNEQKKMYQARNNIILSVLTVAKEAQILEKNNELLKENSLSKTLMKEFSIKNEMKESNELVFADLSFLNPLADELKTLILEDTSTKYSPKMGYSPKSIVSISKQKGTINYDYEVEVLFFSLLGYKDKAQVINQKFNQYFKEFLASLNLPTKITFDHLLSASIEKESYSDFTETEIIILRRIFSNLAKRKFFYGIEFLLKINPYYVIMSEGRIWKNIGLYLNREQVFTLWCIYESNILDVRNADLKTTIDIEYETRIAELKRKFDLLKGKKDTSKKNKVDYTIKELEKEKMLYFVTCLKELLVIFFQYDLKELVMFFFEQFEKKKDEKKVPLEIYEICLDYDEDISIDILDRAVNTNNAKMEYMQIALLKKYFRLARRLLKYKVCKDFLNSTNTVTDNYLFVMHKQQLKKRNEEFTKVMLNKQIKNEGDKLISFLQEGSKKRESQNMQISSDTYSQTASNLLNGLGSIHVSNNDSNQVKEILQHELLLKKSASSSTSIPIMKLSEKNVFKEINKPVMFKQLKKTAVAPKKENKPRTSMTFSSDFFKDKLSSKFRQEKHYHTKQDMDSSNPSFQKSVLSSHLYRTKSNEEIKFANLMNNIPQINVQQILIDQLRFGEYVFDALCLLSSIDENKINLDYSEKTYQYILVFTTSDEAITKCPYPLIVIALAAEYLTKIGRLNKIIQYKTSSVTNELLKLGANLQSSMKNEEMLNFYLREQTDHIGRSALEIYAENNFSPLLNDISVDDIVGRIWFGIGNEQSFFRFFRLTRILTAKLNHEHYNKLVSNNFLPPDSTYIFQFNHYIQNCSIRFFINSVTTTISTVLYETVIYLYVQNTKEDIENFYSGTVRFFNILVNVIAFLNLLNNLLRILYIYKTGRRLLIEQRESYTDLIFGFSVFFAVCNISNCIYDRQEDTNNNFLLNGIVYSILISAAWMRVIFIFMKTYSFGSFFRNTFALLWHVCAFLLICFCFTFLFSQVFTVFFKESNDDFSEIYKGFISLFNTLYGQVEFQHFKYLTVFGYVCLMLFTTVSNIILFNLIVCIINILFNNLEEKGEAENRRVRILVHERFKWDDKYGLLILLPAPLNFFSWFFIVILLIYSKHRDLSDIEKLNFIFSKICYFFIALFYFIGFIIIGVLVFPLSYLKSILLSICDYCFHNKTSCCSTFFSILIRPFSLLIYFLVDLIKFWILVFKEQGINDDRNKKKLFSRQYILALRKVLIKLKYKEKKKVIPLDELYIKLGLATNTKKITSKYSITKVKNEDTSSVISSKLNTISNNNTNIQSTSHNNTINTNPSSSIFRNKPTNNDSVISISSFSDTDKQCAKETMKNLIDKIVDVDGFVDIDRTLLILPFRVKYTNSFLNNLRFTNVRVIQRGIQKYFFTNGDTNQVYLYKKLQLLVFKISIKINLMYGYFQKETLDTMKQAFNNINQDPRFEKSAQTLVQFEQKDDISEYDDSGEAPDYYNKKSDDERR